MPQIWVAVKGSFTNFQESMRCNMLFCWSTQFMQFSFQNKVSYAVDRIMIVFTHLCIECHFRHTRPYKSMCMIRLYRYIEHGDHIAQYHSGTGLSLCRKESILAVMRTCKLRNIWATLEPRHTYRSTTLTEFDPFVSKSTSALLQCI